ncbi:MAG: c-type cytochrome biogenesis protein CcsB [Thermodesulfobacteriota bacterium]|nr:MAG: c-type cytochrome biogenesis protein CcsB [Thermodesulfobacteriota bacterium]
MSAFLYAAFIFYLTSFFVVIAFHVKGAGALSTLSRALVILGLASHSTALVLRVLSTGHAPMASMFETLVFYSWTTVLVTVLVMFRYAERRVEAVTMPVALGALLFAMMNEKPGGPLPLILRTRWFEAHVTLSFAAYALFTLSFAGAALYLFYTSRQGFEAELKRYQEIAAKSVLWGFCLFSAAMFSGAVWAYLAWGTYWLWEPKTLWSFIVWVYYAGAMHAYYVKDWRGKGLSVATVGGFLVVIFTYLGVSLLMKSSHSF